MRLRILTSFLGLCGLLSGSEAQAQLFRPRPSCPPANPLVCPPAAPLPGTTETPMLPNPETIVQNLPPNRFDDAFASANQRGGTSSNSFAENFNGDFGGIVYNRRVVTTTQVATTIPGIFNTVTTVQNVATVAPSRYNGVLLTDNDTPRPTDRAYFGYNYYNGLYGSLNPGLGSASMSRETFGFEKTFLDGNASVGIRLPFIQTNYPGSLGARTVGDLTVLLKYALYNNRETGDVGTVGLIVTTPTGGNNNTIILSDGTTPPSSVLLQPWLGGIKNYEMGYLQAVTSLVIPTDSRDPSLFNNSIAAGYYLYRNATDRLVQAVIPNVEVHARTPLQQRTTDDPIYMLNQVNITSGVHFRSERATLSPAISVPIVGPLPWKYEAVVWLNFRF